MSRNLRGRPRGASERPTKHTFQSLHCILLGRLQCIRLCFAYHGNHPKTIRNGVETFFWHPRRHIRKLYKNRTTSIPNTNPVYLTSGMKMHRRNGLTDSNNIAVVCADVHADMG